MDQLPKDLINLIKEYQRTKFNNVIDELNFIFSYTDLYGLDTSKHIISKKYYIQTMHRDIKKCKKYHEMLCKFKRP